MRTLLVGLLVLAAPVWAAHADPVDDVVRRQMEVSRLPGVAVAVIVCGTGRPLAYAPGTEA